MLSAATVKNTKPAKDAKGNPKPRKLADGQGVDELSVLLVTWSGPRWPQGAGRWRYTIVDPS